MMAKVEVELKKLYQILVDAEYFIRFPITNALMCGIKII